jgi:hypothetical protein
MFVLFVLAVPFSGDFFQGVLVPGVAGGLIFVLIAGSVLKHFGYALW